MGGVQSKPQARKLEFDLKQPVTTFLEYKFINGYHIISASNKPKNDKQERFLLSVYRDQQEIFQNWFAVKPTFELITFRHLLVSQRDDLALYDLKCRTGVSQIPIVENKSHTTSAIATSNPATLNTDLKAIACDAKRSTRVFNFPSMLSSNSTYDFVTGFYQCWIHVVYPENRDYAPLKIGFIQLTISESSAKSQEILFTYPNDIFDTRNPHQSFEFVKYSANRVFCLIPRDSCYKIKLAEIDEKQQCIRVIEESAKRFDFFPLGGGLALYASPSNQQIFVQPHHLIASGEQSITYFWDQYYIFKLYIHTGNNFWVTVNIDNVFRSYALKDDLRYYNFPLWISHDRLIIYREGQVIVDTVRDNKFKFLDSFPCRKFDANCEISTDGVVSKQTWRTYKKKNPNMKSITVTVKQYSCRLFSPDISNDILQTYLPEETKIRLLPPLWEIVADYACSSAMYFSRPNKISTELDTYLKPMGFSSYTFT